jgi:hypothetical protein
MPPAGDPRQHNPPKDLPDPALVAIEDQPYERRQPTGISAGWKGMGFKDYAGKYLLPDPNRGLLDTFFGSDHKVENKEKIHPCLHLTQTMHKCLDTHSDDVFRCRSTLNVLEGCLREYEIYDQFKHGENVLK